MSGNDFEDPGYAHAKVERYRQIPERSGVVQTVEGRRSTLHNSVKRDNIGRSQTVQLLFLIGKPSVVDRVHCARKTNPWSPMVNVNYKRQVPVHVRGGVHVKLLHAHT